MCKKIMTTMVYLNKAAVAAYRVDLPCDVHLDLQDFLQNITISIPHDLKSYMTIFLQFSHRLSEADDPVPVVVCQVPAKAPCLDSLQPL